MHLQWSRALKLVNKEVLLSRDWFKTAIGEIWLVAAKPRMFKGARVSPLQRRGEDVCRSALASP